MPKIVTLFLEEYKPSILRKLLEMLYKRRNNIYDGAIISLWGKDYTLVRKSVREA